MALSLRRPSAAAKPASEPAASPSRRPVVAPQSSAGDHGAYQDWCDALGAPAGFLDYAQLLGLVPRLPRPLSAEEREKDMVLAAAVLEHVRAHQMGPSSFPTQSLRILNLVADPDAEMGDLNKLISQDAALSAAVLKVANSVQYRGVNETETVREAVNRLGLTEVARIAGIVSARTLFDPKVKAEFMSFGPRFNRLFQQSTTVAMGASWLALQKHGARADRTFLTGMLHDIGKSIALRSMAALGTAKKLPVALSDDRCDRVLESIHVAVGFEALTAWSLPSHALSACARHHEENLEARPELLDLHVLRVASALHLLRAEPGLHSHAALELFESARALDLTPHAIRTLDAELKRLQGSVTAMFGATAVRG